MKDDDNATRNLSGDSPASAALLSREEQAQRNRSLKLKLLSLQSCMLNTSAWRIVQVEAGRSRLHYTHI